MRYGQHVRYKNRRGETSEDVSPLSQINSFEVARVQTNEETGLVQSLSCRRFFCLALLMALALRIRRCSLLDTNQRRRRTAVRIPPSVTFLRKRLSRASCDSPSRSLTDMPYHLLPFCETLPQKRFRTVCFIAGHCTQQPTTKSL